MPDLAVNGMARPLITYPLALGVEVAFVPRGTVVEPTPGVVVLDVGGGLCPGVVDHHQPGSGRLCASELVVRQPDLVLDPFVFDADPVVLLTHFAPDLDAACSAFFAWRLLADRKLPDGAVALARYVGDIDRGMVFAQDGFTETLYGVFTVMAQDILDAAAENGQDGGEASAEVLKAGFGLLNDLMGRLDAGTDLHRERLFDHARFRPLTDRLKDDVWTYRRDVERAVTKHVVLPKRGGGTMEVGALFIDDPESLFFK